MVDEEIATVNASLGSPPRILASGLQAVTPFLDSDSAASRRAICTAHDASVSCHLHMIVTRDENVNMITCCVRARLPMHRGRLSSHTCALTTKSPAIKAVDPGDEEQFLRLVT